MISNSLTTAKHAKILARITCVYGAERAPEILADITSLLSAYLGKIPVKTSGWSERDAMLITYADTITGEQAPLRMLDHFLRQEIGDLITFIHLLPVYPYSSDDGFSVQDFLAIRPDLGTWNDIKTLAESYRLVLDAVINHVSASSRYMEGYCAGDPAYADFFLALDPSTDTSSVLRTRNLPLLHDYPTHDGVKWLWTTFSRDQVDLNYANPRVLLEILDIMLSYAARGATMMRLDAIPYLWKELGTSCAHLPQTHELIKLLRDIYDIVAPHVLLLTETNVPHQENLRYFGDGGDEAQMIYNFALAPLILWAVQTGDATALTQWASGIEWIGPRATYLNITATHDGIGMRPTEGLLSEEARARLVQLAYDHHGDVAGKRNADGSVAPYELNLSYFDAINDPDSEEPTSIQLQRFLLSQAIPMALMGIPGIYIHSLLGSRNDVAAVQATGRARSINRTQLALDPLVEALHDPTTLRGQVFHEMTRLLRIRKVQPAFHPDAHQEILDCGPGVFVVRRYTDEEHVSITALHNVTPLAINIPASLLGMPEKISYDLLADERLDLRCITLQPYQVRWVTHAALSRSSNRVVDEAFTGKISKQSDDSALLV